MAKKITNRKYTFVSSVFNQGLKVKVLQKFNKHFIGHGYGFINGLTVHKQRTLSGIWVNHGHPIQSPIKLTKRLNRQLLKTERN